MGRWNLFVLVFVAGLIAASLLVIGSVSTKLGLDLKGGVELIYQGTPTNQVESVSGSDIERSIEIIRERVDELGVSEPEVSRLGLDQISVSLPDVTNAQRAIDQVGTTAQLYFYDWEPNVIGPSGKPAGPSEPTVTGGEQAGAAQFGLPEYEAVQRAVKRPPILRANATTFGLGSGVWTRDVSKANRLAKGIRAGSVLVNCYQAMDPAVPFGGYKMSGYGRESGLQQLDEIGRAHV